MNAKLSVNFCSMDWMAVIIPIKAIIPKAIIAIVIPDLNLLLLTDRQANKNDSFIIVLISKCKVN